MSRSTNAEVPSGQKAPDLYQHLLAKQREAAGVADISPLDVPFECLATPHMARTSVQAWIASVGRDLEGIAAEVDYCGEYRI